MIFKTKDDPPLRPIMPTNSLVQRQQEDEDNEPDKLPLDWDLIRRLFTYTNAYSRKRNILFFLTLIRSLQLPALTLITSKIIGGPVAHGDYRMVLMAVLAYGILAIATDSSGNAWRWNSASKW